MISGISLHNVAIWSVQVFLITSIGALLPILFRIQHSQSKLVYYRLLLVATLLLPLIQPIQHEVVVLNDAQPAATSAAGGVTHTMAPPPDPIRWSGRDVFLGLLAVGFIVRIGWL